MKSGENMYTTINVIKKSKNTVINKTVEILQKGGLVIFPSDTVYGLLVDATNKEAVDKLISFKNRPPGKAISIFVADFKMMYDYVHIKENQERLLHHLLPWPFTIILESRHTVNSQLESEKGTLGIRIPDYSLVTDLVAKFGKPVTATSANLGGKSPHYSVESLLNQLPKSKLQLIDLIVDAGILPRNKPSTVVDISQPEMKVLRQGDIVFSGEKSFISKSAAQTQKLGAYFVEQYSKNNNKPLVFILQGDLGTGKTVLAKGMASYLGIEKIISPTFVVYYEYDIPSRIAKRVTRNVNKFIHADLYNIEDQEEFKHLGLEEYLKDGNVIVVEWGEKLGDIYEEFKKKAKVIYINISYTGEDGREIKIQL